jgi:uncharacterized membrane protein YfcA
MSRAILWPVVTGVATTALLVVWRNFFWQHALIVGIGAAALVYTGIRTVQRLRQLHKR